MMQNHLVEAGTTPGSSRTVAICGAFDMKNFGDLLFPVLAKDRLTGQGYDIVPYAPSSSNPGFQLPPPRPIRELFDTSSDVDAVMIGGGYIIHGWPLSGMVKRDTTEAEKEASAELLDCWMGGTVAAALRGVPIVWNAPGVPFPFATRQTPMLTAVAEAADYLALRDQASAKLLLPDSDGGAGIVPDPIAEISRIWPKQSLRQVMKNFRDRYSLDSEAQFVAINVRDRSLSGIGAEKLAALIDAFSMAHRLVPVLIAVGDAHNDSETALSVERHLAEDHVVLRDPDNLKEIAAILAYSRLYIGSSLHGYIVATSYGVPGALVARPAYRKFEGYVQHAGWPEDLCFDWFRAFERAETLVSGASYRPLPDHVFKDIDNHWKKMQSAIAGSAPLAAARSGFLHRYVGISVENSGAPWVTQPFNAH